MLLADSFTDHEPAAAPGLPAGGLNAAGRRNTSTLPVFWPPREEKADPPVVLCTDDNGIWAIRNCREHYPHISVAHEYCQAIVKSLAERDCLSAAADGDDRRSVAGCVLGVGVKQTKNTQAALSVSPEGMCWRPLTDYLRGQRRLAPTQLLARVDSSDKVLLVWLRFCARTIAAAAGLRR